MSQAYEPRPTAQPARPPNERSSVMPPEPWPLAAARQAPPVVEAATIFKGLAFVVSTDRRHIVVHGPGGYLTLNLATARSLGQMLQGAADDIEAEDARRIIGVGRPGAGPIADGIDLIRLQAGVGVEV